MDYSLRVSCSGFVRVCLDDKLIGTLNKNALKSRGEKVYTVPGGGLQYKGRKAKQFLEKEVGVLWEKPNTQNLRFRIEGTSVERDKKLALFARWFAERKGRELYAWREMFEEFIQEENILSRLGNEYPKVTKEPYRTERIRRFTDRAVPTGRLTESFWEFFDVHLTKKQTDALSRRLRQLRTSARLLSRNEIEAGVADNDILIGKECFVYLL